METIEVGLAERAYPIHIGNGLGIGQLARAALPRTRDLMVVTNTTVGPLQLGRVMGSLGEAGFAPRSLELPDGERYKTVDSWMSIHTGLLEAGFGRDCAIVALGGGVVGDLAGFAAATYQRGIPFIQVPTTLLAMVDASVGGKTAFNHPLGKNMVGAFWQPRAVLADLGTLGTLPRRELAAGMGEVIKTAILGDAGLFGELERDSAAAFRLDGDFLLRAVRRCCEIKARVVAEDERERGMRALLNLGHTFGHAVEAFLGFGTWLHGEAVGLGLVMAATLSERRGILPSGVAARIAKLCSECDLPIEIPTEMKDYDFIKFMRHDKKVRDGAVRYVLPVRLGECRVFSDVGDDEVRSLVGEMKGRQATI
ncbi:MAG: 3-dehydroquinate synthase [Succinivibrionaceae bacterium]|nr:3-dehydroquinate synthase [Succinivibrionaceae bacterium]